jgi:hypothetical protein
MSFYVTVGTLVTSLYLLFLNFSWIQHALRAHVQDKFIKDEQRPKYIDVLFWVQEAKLGTGELKIKLGAWVDTLCLIRTVT